MLQSRSGKQIGIETLALFNFFYIGRSERLNSPFPCSFFVSEDIERIEIMLNFIMALLTHKISSRFELEFNVALFWSRLHSSRLSLFSSIAMFNTYDTFVSLYCFGKPELTVISSFVEKKTSCRFSQHFFVENRTLREEVCQWSSRAIRKSM